MILHNLKVAVRNLMKYKLQTWLNIICIAVGIAAFSLVHSLLSNVRLPAVYEQSLSDRAYDLTFTQIGSGEKAQINLDIIRALKKDGGPQSAELVAVPTARMSGAETEFILPDSTVRRGFIEAECLDPDYLRFEGFQSSITGEKITGLKKGEAIIGEGSAKKIFKDKSPVGSVQKQTGPVQPIPVRIVDVYRDIPSRENLACQDELLFCIEDRIEDQELDLFFLTPCINVVLKEGYSKEQLLKDVNQRISPFGIEARLTKTLTDDEIRSHYVYKTILYLVGVMILFAAMVGFLRTQIQMFRIKRGELALRVVNGAKKKELFGMLFTEPALVIMISGIIAIIFDMLLQEHTADFDRMMQASGIRINHIGWYSFLIGGVLLVTAAIITWLSLQKICNASGNLAKNMRRSRNHLFRNFMLGFQISISLVFVCGTIILIKTCNDLLRIYNIPQNDSTLSEYLWMNLIYSQRQGKVDEIISEIRRMPEFQRLALYDPSVTYIHEVRNNPEVMDKLANRAYYNCNSTNDKDMPSLMGMDVEWMAGVSDRDECLLVGEDLYKQFADAGLSDAKSLTISVGGEAGALTLPIGGIIRNIPYERGTKRLVAISKYFEKTLTSYVLIPKSGKGEALCTDVAEIIGKCAPENFYDSVSKYVNSFYWLPHTIKAVYAGCFILGLVSLLICSMGIFSAIALDTRSRRKEVAIRKVNGAKSMDIYRLFGRMYVVLLAVSLAIAVPISVMFSKIINEEGNSFIFHDTVSPVMPVIIGSLIVIIFILGIVFWQIRHVMRVDPAKIIAKE